MNCATPVFYTAVYGGYKSQVFSLNIEYIVLASC